MLIKKVTDKKDIIESYYNSSNILKSIYHTKTNDLDIVFSRGAVYRYLNVPLKIFEQFEGGLSQGKFLNKQIRNKYSTNKVAEVDTNKLVEEVNRLIQRAGKIDGMIDSNTTPNQ